MIEIFAIYLCCKNLGKMLRAKGHSAIGLQVALVILWFVGQFLGGVTGAIIQMIVSGPSEGINPFIYLCALLGAAAGALTVFFIAHMIKPRLGNDQKTHAFPVETSQVPPAN